MFVNKNPSNFIDLFILDIFKIKEIILVKQKRFEKNKRFQ